MIYAADVTRLEVRTAPGVWTNITNPTQSISITRADGDVGTLTASVADVSLDPTVSDQIRPGRVVRLLSRDQSGWRVIFTGTIRQGLTVDYHPLSRHTVQITLPATDNVAYLANLPEARGVATIDGLRWLLDGVGVPFIINGATTPQPPQTVVSTNDSASLWQQILATRDSALGQAWVDTENQLRAYDADQLNNAPVATLDTSVYSNLDVGFNDEQIINSVTVNFLRYAPISGTTTEIPYGPYEDAASIAEWDRWSATVTLQGVVEDAAVIAAYAAQILARNASGADQVRSATIPIRDAASLRLTRLDLGQVVTVVRTDDTTTEQLRIVGITHEITGTNWTMTLTFARLDAAAFPSTTPGTGISIIPPGSVGTPELAPIIIDQIETALTDSAQAIEDAAEAITAATSAETKATNAMTAANGKNKVTWSASAASGAGQEGDVWYRLNSAGVIGMWRYTAGDWVTEPLQDQAIAGLSVGKLLAGAINAIVITLADTGRIESENYAANTSGWRLGATGLEINNGTLTAPNIQTAPGTTKTLRLNSAGLVAYDASGAPALAYSTATGGLTVKGEILSGSTVSGTLTSGTSSTRRVVLQDGDLKMYRGSAAAGTINGDSTGGLALTSANGSGITLTASNSFPVRIASVSVDASGQSVSSGLVLLVGQVNFAGGGVSGYPGRALGGDGYDSGWQTLALASGWSGTAQYRIVGGVVYMRGGVSRASGSSTTIAALNDVGGIRPAQTLNMLVRAGTTAAPALNLSLSSASGMVISSNYTNGNNVWLESIGSYPLG